MMSFVLGIAVTAASARADDIDDALAAYDRKDFATALRVLLPAAEEGEQRAMNTLGLMYLNGEGVARDTDEGKKWIGRAADQGDASAQFSLGVDLAVGHGVPVDLVEAHKWISLAAGRYSAEQSAERATAAGVLAELAPSMTPAQIAAARRRAREWTPKPEPFGDGK